MRGHLSFICLAVGVWLASACGSALSATDLVASLQARLYAGETAKAAEIARARLADAPFDAQAQFALGAVQFLQAVEHLGQGLHRYGLRSYYIDDLGLSGLPFLRLPVPENKNPEPVTYEALRSLLADFVRDLDVAEATLAAIKSEQVDLPLNIGLIRLDLDGNGTGNPDEALWHLFAALTDARWLRDAEAAKLLVDFDGSDVPWLQAYCRLLKALAQFPLAYDWHEAFEATFHSVFPSARLPMTDAVNVPSLITELHKLSPLPDPNYDDYDNWVLTPEGQRYRRMRDIDNRLWIGGYSDLIAFVHLNHWPVIEPQRLTHVRENLLGMIKLSRENWKRILAETDDRNEWIPSPKQSGALPRMQVVEARVQGLTCH